MASSSFFLMTTTTTTTLFLVLLSVHVHVHVLVVVAENPVFENPLVSMTCRDEFKIPDTCYQCINSDPRKDQANEVVIATIIVDCAATRSHILSGSFSSAYLLATNQTYKDDLDNCVSKYMYSEVALNDASLALKIGDYGKAAQSVFDAIMQRVYCNRVMHEDLGDDIPYDDRFLIRAFQRDIIQQLTDAALQMINRF